MIARRIAYDGLTLGALSLTGMPGMKQPFGTPAIETRHVSHTNRYRGADAENIAFFARLGGELEETITDVGPTGSRRNDRRADPERGRPPRPARRLRSAALALESLEIFERDRVLEHVRATAGSFEREVRRLKGMDVVGDVRGDGFFWARRAARRRPAGRAVAGRRQGPGRPRAAAARTARRGLIARPDDRGDAVVRLAPPLICDRGTLAEIVDRLGAALEAVAPVMRGGRRRVAA